MECKPPQKIWDVSCWKSHSVCRPRQRGSRQSITARALGNQHTRTVCSPCAQSTPITSARHMNPLYYRGTESQTDGQKITDREKQKWTGKLSFVQFISPACAFHQSAFPFPFYSDSELPQTHTNYGLQVCVVTAPPKPTTLAMFGTFKYIIFYKKYSQCKIRCKAVV